jgi:pyridoxamine 5'-phosphate oxidase
MPDHSTPLLEQDVRGDPFDQFADWYAAASAVVRAPEAMAVATATREGRPSVRMVLMKAWDRGGVVFYTQYRSRKAEDLEDNPRGALLFHWDQLGRQIRIEGPVERTSASESDEYFATRPTGARISAHASRQSAPIGSRDALEARFEAVARTYEGSGVPRPDTWGGYRLLPEVFEFWQNRDDRLHDRLRYALSPEGWRLERLQP